MRTRCVTSSNSISRPMRSPDFADQRRDGNVDDKTVAFADCAAGICRGWRCVLRLGARAISATRSAGNSVAQFDGRRLRCAARRTAAPSACSRIPRVPSRSTASTPTFSDSTIFSLKSLSRSICMRLLLERVVKLRVVERDRDVARDGVQQFDVFAGKEIAVDRLAEAQHRDGVLANPAGHKVIQVELLERLANRVATVSSARARRFVKEVPAANSGRARGDRGNSGPVGSDSAHAHRTRQSGTVAGCGVVLDEKSRGDRRAASAKCGPSPNPASDRGALHWSACGRIRSACGDSRGGRDRKSDRGAPESNRGTAGTKTRRSRWRSLPP